MKRFVINGNDSGQRVDKFLSKALPMLPQSAMYKGIRTKNIKVNRKRCEISTRLREGDVVEIYLPEDMLGERESEYAFMNVKGDIDIVYEDENILLMDKKCGLVVHEDNEGGGDTLINRMLKYLYDKGEYDPEKENSFTPALCNRLDRNTGGIVIAAKNAEALRILNEKIRNREIDKRYLCIVSGVPPKKEDTLTHYLFKDSKSNRVTVSDRKTAANKTIVTRYRVLKSNGKLSLLEIELLTGRTHQIRAHMAYIGCPLLGDGKYGSNRINREYCVKTQALYSYKLRFDFKGDSGILEYLNGREFTAEKVWFKDFI
ncbi:MAG: RluA family pseudouridine synthase [Ruminococcus sp.]|nr:RluA family pseudouridine synthase [Ruminococcus sp.]